MRPTRLGEHCFFRGRTLACGAVRAAAVRPNLEGERGTEGKPACKE